jgi:processive 1,2-diacylglycerol beta-glucosyltransferase
MTRSRYTSGMVRLVDTESGQAVGTISDEQLEYLQAQLEEESPEDRDYWFDAASLDILEEAGADPALLTVLRTALGDREEMELRWERD